MKTKIQHINAAFSELRISGITSGPSADDVELALEVYEDMMRELVAKYPTLEFNFEEVPDPNSSSGVDAKFNNAIQLKLGDTIGFRYGKTVDQKRLAMAMASLSAKLAPTPEYQSSSRMPAGRGNNNRYSRNFDFMPPYAVADPSSLFMGITDARFISEDLSDYMRPAETLASAVVTSDSGLIVTGTTTTGNTVEFTVTANGVAAVNLKVTIVITGTLGNISKRILFFTTQEHIAVGQ
jgi:hypothetical protein